MDNLRWCYKACTVFLICAATATAGRAQVFTTVANFTGYNGGNPSLVQGTDGTFHGTQPTAQGTVFKVTPGGKLTTLYTFCAQPNCTDGYSPLAGLVLAADGNFYGTTADGGANGCCAGTVFKITLSGKLTTLYSFCALPNCIDGYTPLGSLVEGTDGNFYGTTEGGGDPNCTSSGCGTVFKITPGGVLTTLHRFDFWDGVDPRAGLVQATNGDFYGTTFYGGENSYSCSDAGCGTVFKITSAGALTTLHSFDGADGAQPNAGLVLGTDGNFYGTTTFGGIGGLGTVFQLTAEGTLTTLYAFGDIDGFGPTTLVQGTDGNFYGVAAGGLVGWGTIFEITPTGMETTLHNFCVPRTPTGWSGDQCPDGARPEGLLQATDGKFYGTTFEGGGWDSGTVFSLDMGFGPFVTFVRAAGKVGQTGGILGQGLTGTTAVSFNGTPANFTVVSDTYIRATVPEGATTGYVTVTTPTGALTSNVQFHVIP